MKCSKCGADAEDDAKFCPECGYDLKESETKNISNNQINNEIKSKGILSFLDDWNEWSAGKKNRFNNYSMLYRITNPRCNRKYVNS